MSIAEMADHELDAAVAREVMGWTDPLHIHEECEARHGRATRYWLVGQPSLCSLCKGRQLPRFSTDIAAAFEVVEAMNRFWTLIKGPRKSRPGWIAEFWKGGDIWRGRAVHASLPRAICEAALDARRVVERT